MGSVTVAESEPHGVLAYPGSGATEERAPSRRQTAVDVAKRRAAGPAVKKKPKTPSDAQAAGLARRQVCCWSLGLVGALVGGRRASSSLYQRDRHPRPQRGLRGRRPPTSTTPAARPSSASSPPRTASRSRSTRCPTDVKDAVVAAENQTFWTDTGHRPQGHRPGGVQQRPRERHPGCVDDHPAVRQDPLPDPGAQPRPQGEGGDPLAQAAAAAEQGGDPRGLPQHHLLRPRRLRHPGRRRRRSSTSRAKDLTLREAAVLASVLNNPTALRPRQRQGRQGGPQGALRVRPGRDGGDGHDRRGRGREGREAAAEVPRDRRREPVRRPARPHAQAGPRRAAAARLHRARRSTAVACGSPPRSPRRTWRPPSRACSRSGRRASTAAQLHVAVATVEPGTGALRGFYGGQDYLDSQINWAVAGGMVGSTFKPFTLTTAIKEGFSLEDTFEGNSPYEFPDGLDGAQRGRGRRQRLRVGRRRDVRPGAVDQHRVRRHDATRSPTARTRSSRPPTGAGHPPEPPGPEVPRHPQQLAATSRPTR